MPNAQLYEWTREMNIENSQKSPDTKSAKKHMNQFTRNDLTIDWNNAMNYINDNDTWAKK